MLSFLTPVQFTDVVLSIFAVFLSGFAVSASIAGIRDFVKTVINRY